MQIDPLNREHRTIFNRLKRQKRLAALVLVIERLSAAALRPLIWIMVFFGLWLFQVPAIFGQAGSILALLAFIIGGIYLAYQDLWAFRWPSASDIHRRLEDDSAIKHRPLSGIEDQLSNPEKTETRALWDKNQAALARLLPSMRVKAPRGIIASRDPYALRLGALTLFILGLIVAGPLWKARIHDGLTPPLGLNLAERSSGVALWITPPDYTGAAQIILSDEQTEEPLQVPQGSVLKASVSGGFGTPQIHVDRQVFAMKRGVDKNYSAEMTLPAGQNLSIKQSLFNRASWEFVTIPDHTPAIIIDGEADALPDGPVRFPVMLYDDYGVEFLDIRMDLSDIVEDAPPIGRALEERRTVLSPAETQFKISPLYDLTAHPWAGLPVRVRFTAHDHIKQSAQSEAVEITLPERTFSHPVAKELIALRRGMIWAPLEDYKARARELEIILSMPGAYQHNKVVFLALRAASSRLHHNAPSIEVSESLVHLLWDIALRIEDGNLSFAARDLKDAQKRLEEALQNPNTSDEQIAQLMEELRQAMAQYLMELQQEMQKRLAQNGQMQMSLEQMQQMMSPDALADFLNQMESQMLSGDRKSAQEMLAELQRFTENLNPSMAQPMPEDMKMMAEGVNELQELIERQEELLKQTMRQAGIMKQLDKLSGQFSIPAIDTQENKVEQEALRFVLGQLMLDAADVLDDIPEEFALAEQEMRGSSEQLGGNKPGQSVPYQSRALEHLKDTQQQLAQQYMARMKQMGGMMMGSGMPRDPLGRPYNEDGNGNPMFGSKVKIPNDAERKQAREIQELLRRRAGEHDRPDAEREYYRRLLKQF